MGSNILTILTSSIIAAIVMAGICAVIQAVVKVRAHRQLGRGGLGHVQVLEVAALQALPVAAVDVLPKQHEAPAPGATR